MGVTALFLFGVMLCTVELCRLCFRLCSVVQLNCFRPFGCQVLGGVTTV